MHNNVITVIILVILSLTKHSNMHLIYRRAISNSELENLSKDSEFKVNSVKFKNQEVEDNINNNEMTSNNDIFMNQLYDNNNEKTLINNPFVSNMINNEKDWRKKRKWRRDIDSSVTPYFSLLPNGDSGIKLLDLPNVNDNITTNQDLSSILSRQNNLLTPGTQLKTINNNQVFPEEKLEQDKLYGSSNERNNDKNSFHYNVNGGWEKSLSSPINEANIIKNSKDAAVMQPQKLKSNNLFGNSYDITLLQEIAEDLEDLRKNKDQCKGNEGMPCSINGSWVSQLGGVRFDIEACDSGSINASICDTTPKTEGLLSTNWIINGIAPFSHGGPFSLTAIEKETKQLAVFVGQCRVCNKIESITGWWTFGRPTRDCQDVSQAEEMHPDLFQREYLHTMRAIKLREIKHEKTGVTSTATTKSNSSTSTTPYAFDIKLHDKV